MYHITNQLKLTKMTTTIETLKANLEIELKPYYEIQDNRWERYMNCQDDSIIGGISDNVTSNTISTIKRKYDLFIEQFENGGFLTSQSNMLCLFDLDGNYITDNIVNGKFGECFCFTNNGETKFVSLSKKESTYEKKGYKTAYRVRTFIYNFYGKKTSTGNWIFENIEISFEHFTNQNNENINKNSWINYLYQNKK